MALTRILLFETSVTQANRRADDGVFRFAKTAHWDVRPIEYAFCHVARMRQEVPGNGIPDVRAIVELWNPNGVIVECAGRTPAFPLNVFGDIPVVLLDCDPRLVGKRQPCVYVDEKAVVRAAAQELLRPAGIEDYAYVPYVENTVWSQSRRDLFADMVSLNGNRLHVFKPESCNGPVSKWFDKPLRAWLKALPKPCGLFAANDGIARQILDTCEMTGISVPDDIVIVGVDDDETLCEHGVTSLSSVRIDYEQAGYCAAELLARCLAPRGRKHVGSLSFGVVGVVRRASSRRYPDARLGIALEAIRRRATVGISPEDVASILGCSRRFADVLFVSALGHTIFEEIRNVRLGRVTDLLANERQQIAAIPDLCGYSSLQVLCRDFKRRFGISMRDWRSHMSSKFAK